MGTVSRILTLGLGPMLYSRRPAPLTPTNAPPADFRRFGPILGGVEAEHRVAAGRRPEARSPASNPAAPFPWVAFSEVREKP
jgi:hypothetical protein